MVGAGFWLNFIIKNGAIASISGLLTFISTNYVAYSSGKFENNAAGFQRIYFRIFNVINRCRCFYFKHSSGGGDSTTEEIEMKESRKPEDADNSFL
jgi:hypothetical protein